MNGNPRPKSIINKLFKIMTERHNKERVPATIRYTY